MTDQVIDATVEPSTDLVPVPPAALFAADSPAQVVDRATEVADALRDVLRNQNLTQNIKGREHVKVEGWQLAGALLGVTAICTSTEPIANGYKATVEARTPDGHVQGRADAICTHDEQKWKDRDDYALLSMAQTRATSKALKGPLGFVVSLAGYATTPSEEMDWARRNAVAETVQTPAQEDRSKAARLATAAQRTAIRQLAFEKNLLPSDVANMLLVGTGQKPRKWDDQTKAQESVNAWLEKLPASAVDDVLGTIDRVPPEPA
jgi:hypothetical protein